VQQILLIEDSPEAQLLVKSVLGRQYQITVVDNLADAQKRVDQKQFDLVLLDIMLPDGDGFQFLVTLKNDPTYKKIPVLVMTGKTGVSDQVMGYTLGAEDYITKPVQPLVLQARVDSKIKKYGELKAGEDSFDFAGLRFVISLQKVYYKDSLVDLTPLEFKLFLHLVKNPDSAFTRNQIKNIVWGEGIAVGNRTVDTHLSNLRNKIKDFSVRIESVRGVGYRLVRRDIREAA
jgi:DNA-binding response OmpR family regulator